MIEIYRPSIGFAFFIVFYIANNFLFAYSPSLLFKKFTFIRLIKGVLYLSPNMLFGDKYFYRIWSKQQKIAYFFCFFLSSLICFSVVIDPLNSHIDHNIILFFYFILIFTCLHFSNLNKTQCFKTIFQTVFFIFVLKLFFKFEEKSNFSQIYLLGLDDFFLNGYYLLTFLAFISLCRLSVLTYIDKQKGLNFSFLLVFSSITLFVGTFINAGGNAFILKKMALGMNHISFEVELLLTLVKYLLVSFFITLIKSGNLKVSYSSNQNHYLKDMMMVSILIIAVLFYNEYY